MDSKKFGKFAVIRQLVITIIIAGMFALVGCSSKSGESNNEASKAAATNATMANNTTSAASAGKVYIVGTSADYPPFEYISTDDPNKIVGFDIDMLNAAAEAAGVKIEYQNIPFDSIVTALGSGKIDLAVSAMTISPERQQAVNFTTPYFNNTVVALTLANDTEFDNTTDLATLKGVKVSVQQGTTSYDAGVKYNGEDAVVPFSVELDAIQELLNGRVKVSFLDTTVAKVFLAKYPNQIKQLNYTFDSEQYGIAVSKNNPQLVEALNKGLQNISENGKLQSIIDKYFGANAAPAMPAAPSTTEGSAPAPTAPAVAPEAENQTPAMSEAKSSAEASADAGAADDNGAKAENDTK